MKHILLSSLLFSGCTLLFDPFSQECGDFILQEKNNEICDDGNTINGDGCDANCIFTACGNGVQTIGEQCDDGNTIDNDGCDSLCQIELSICGDGLVESGEQCDDGNPFNGDGCSGVCLIE